MTLMNARIRAAGPDDVPVLVELMTAFYDEGGYPLPRAAATRAFQSLLAEPALGRVWIIERDGEPVGHIVLTLGFSMEYGGLRGFVDDFFVCAEHRNQGLGAFALTTVRQACQQLGVRALLVETGSEGHPARRLYERAGFTENGRVFLIQAFAAAVHESAQDL
jgi:GNAT superfamily N-acetyltransferase